jgi:nucleotide-binding universal stress UspA family protein
MPYSSILVSLAGKNEEIKLVSEAVKLAQKLGSSLTFVHVNDPHAGKMNMMMDSLKKITETEIRKFLADFGQVEISKTSKVLMLESEKYSHAIAEAAKDYDLLIIGHHNKNSFLAALVDSTDEHTSDLVDCPVLLVSL